MASFIPSRQLFAGIGLIVIIMAAISFLYVSKQSDMPSKTNESPVAKFYATKSKRVFIDNLNEIEAFSEDPSIQTRIKQVLWVTASHGSQEKNLYTGTVQKNSYKETLQYSASGNVNIKTLRVDVEPIKKTYTVAVRSKGRASEINVVCAPEEFQIDKTATCEEMDWH